MAKHNEYARQARVAQNRDRPWAKNRADLEAAAATHMRAAENHLKAAMSSSSCRDVPKILAIAAERFGRAQEAAASAVGGKRGRKSGQLAVAIRRVGNQIHQAVSGYAHGDCVTQLAGLGRARRRAPKRRAR